MRNLWPLHVLLDAAIWFACPDPSFAAERAKLVVVAVDESGSMVKSDPGRARIEAAGMMLALATGQDEVGIIGFGTSARWVQEPTTRTPSSAAANVLQGLGQTDAHTDFYAPIRLFSDYLRLKSEDYLETHDVSLIVLTDGKADPVAGSAEQNELAALAAARGVRMHCHIHAIGLGRDADMAFLGTLTRETGGSRVSAGSARDLADAFLQILTKVYFLPVYGQLERPGTLQWSGKPERILLFFFGDEPGSLSGVSERVFSSAQILVVKPRVDSGKCAMDWKGSGVVFLAVREALRLVPNSPFPASLLTDTKAAGRLEVTAGDRPLRSEYFLQNSTVAIEFRSGESRILAPFQRDSNGGFTGTYSVDTPGDYQVYGRLTAPYGEIRTYIRAAKVSATPVQLPRQITLPVFDPLKRGWFSRSVRLTSTLPTGATTLTFQNQSQVAQVANPEIILEPSHGARLVLTPGQFCKPGESDTISYTAAWGEGQSRTLRTGAVSVQIRQMGVSEFIGDKWEWLVVLLGLVLLTGYGVEIYRPRPLTGCLTIVHKGKLVLRLDLPRDRALFQMKIIESSCPHPVRPDEVTIPGDRDRSLVTLKSERRGRRWVCIAETGSEPLLTPQGVLPRNADLSSRRCASFCTQDRAIEIKFF